VRFEEECFRNGRLCRNANVTATNHHRGKRSSSEGRRDTLLPAPTSKNWRNVVVLLGGILRRLASGSGKTSSEADSFCACGGELRINLSLKAGKLSKSQFHNLYS